MRVVKVSEAGTVFEAERDVSRALEALSDADLMRLKALARLGAHGLPGMEWADLLNETILRALNGSRRWPVGVPLIAFLALTMRSVCDECWRRVRRERRVVVASVAEKKDAYALSADDSPGGDPERAAAAAQTLRVLLRLFSEDEIAMKIIVGLADGLSAAEIRDRNSLTETEYDTVRKRMRRALLRHGLGGLER